MASKLLVLVAAAGVLVVAGCPKGTTGGDTAADLGSTATTESHGFTVLAELQHVCGQSVLGQDGTEILWDLFWSAREPADVAQAYRETLGTAGLEEADGDWTWRVPAEGVPDRVLNVMAADAPHPDCGAVPADAKSVAVFSEMFRRTPPAAEPDAPLAAP